MTVHVRKLQPYHPGLLGGWNATSGDLNQTNVSQNINAIVDNNLQYYIGVTIASGTNVFRWASKATPTVWTSPVFPQSSVNVNSLVAHPNNDSVFIGNSVIGASRVYRWNQGAGTFTNMNYPDSADTDVIASMFLNPENSDQLFVGQAPDAAGNVNLWRLDITAGTWTNVHSFGAGGGQSRSIAGITYGGGRLYVGFSGGTVNEARVYRSSGSPFTIWTQIAGDGVNGSWATGTFRSIRPIVLNGVLYAGIGGSTAGDAEVWRASDLAGSSWTKIGGDGVNGSWAAGTKTSSVRVGGRANMFVVGMGAGANDGEVWQWNNNTSVWTKVMGDAVNGSFTRNAVNAVWVDREGRLLAGAGNNSVNTSALFRNPGTIPSSGNQGSGYAKIAIRVP